MDLFLARFAETLPVGVHAVLLLDQAGWHGKAALHVPDNVTLLPLPPYSPELNPVERVWPYLRERSLSFRLDHDEQAIVDALCTAWNASRAETGRLTSLTSYPWLMHAIEQVNGWVNGCRRAATQRCAVFSGPQGQEPRSGRS